MATQNPFAIFRKPLVIGGLGLTAGVWLWESLLPTGMDWSGLLIWGSALTGTGLWWLRRRQSATLPDEVMKPLSKAQFQQEVERLEGELRQLKSEGGEQGSLQAEALEQQIRQCKASLTRLQLKAALVGAEGVGKTTLLQQLQVSGTNLDDYEIEYIDTPGLFGADAAEDALATLKGLNIAATDLVLFVVNGDLVEAEHSLVQSLLKQGHRVLVACNKWDRYLPSEQPSILQRVRHHLSQISEQDILPVMAAPAAIKRRLHQADGAIQESLVTPAADVAALVTRVAQVVQQEGPQLVLGSASRQLSALATEARGYLNGHRRQQAMPIIERYQWLTGATAFANPLPTLDVVAAAAINGQMVLDLGQLYKRSLSVDQAEVTAKALAEVMVKLGLVEIASQAISPLLKSHLVTYAAGGALQGLSAAYLTRVAGLSLIEYFEAHPTDTAINMGRLTPILQRLMSQQRRLEPLKQFVQQGVKRLAPAAAAPAV